MSDISKLSEAMAANDASTTIPETAAKLMAVHAGGMSDGAPSATPAKTSPGAPLQSTMPKPKANSGAEPETAESTAAAAMAFLAPALTPISSTQSSAPGQGNTKRVSVRPKFKPPNSELEEPPTDKRTITLGKVYLLRGIPKIWDGRQWRKICMTDWCARYAVSAGHCKAHGGGNRCTRLVMQVNSGISNMVTCGKSAVDRTPFCKAHGGGKRCAAETVNGISCPKSAAGNTNYCKSHGGGRRCTMAGCTKSAVCPTTTCISHGGGKRCSFVQVPMSNETISKPEQRTCGKSARGPTGFCLAHAACGQCCADRCEQESLAGSTYCTSHVEIQGHYDTRMSVHKRARTTSSGGGSISRSADPRSLLYQQQQQSASRPQQQSAEQAQRAQAHAGLAAMKGLPISTGVPGNSLQAMQRTQMALWQQQQQQQQQLSSTMPRQGQAQAQVQSQQDQRWTYGAAQPWSQGGVQPATGAPQSVRQQSQGTHQAQNTQSQGGQQQYQQSRRSTRSGMSAAAVANAGQTSDTTAASNSALSADLAHPPAQTGMTSTPISLASSRRVRARSW